MIHTSEDGNPAAAHIVRGMFSTKGMNQMGKRGNIVRLHGLSNLDEAMAIKGALDEKGLSSAVTLSPGDFEYHIKMQGHKPFVFEVSLPVDFNLDEARSMVNNAVVADDEHLDAALLKISTNPCFSTVSQELTAKIHQARDYVKQALSKDLTMDDPITPITQTDMNAEHITPIVAAATGKTVAEVDAIATNNQPSEENAPTMTQATTTTETITRSVTQSPADQPTPGSSTNKILGVNKKHLYMGAAAVVAVGLGVFGWKNADKITSIFSRNPA